MRLRQLSVEDAELPSPLRGIVRDLSLFGKSRGVIHRALQSTLLKARRADLRLDDIDDAAFASDIFCDRLVHSNLHPYKLDTHSSACPPLDQVLDIHAAAKECHNEMHPEASWNMLVHQQILALAVSPCWVNDGAVHFMPCTTTKIQPAYRRGSGAGSAKMVDPTMFIEPSFFGDNDNTAVDTTRKLLSNASINHTDFAPLRRRPIALSIESKTTGHQLLEAEVQVGVWLAAQWRMLESLPKRPTPELDIATNPSVAGLPSFLPAIIIQGHDWHFVATTRSRECTTLWAKLTFGSSETVLSIKLFVCYGIWPSGPSNSIGPLSASSHSASFLNNHQAVLAIIAPAMKAHLFFPDKSKTSKLIFWMAILGGEVCQTLKYADRKSVV